MLARKIICQENTLVILAVAIRGKRAHKDSSSAKTQGHSLMMATEVTQVLSHQGPKLKILRENMIRHLDLERCKKPKLQI